MGSPIESEFAEVCGKIRGKAKPKCRSSTGDEFKNILIPSNCSYLKTSYLNSEIYNKLHDASTNRDKGAQRKQSTYVKDTIPLMQAVVNLKEIEKKAKKELSKETFSKLRDISPLLRQSIRMQNILFTETQRKRKYDVCSTLGKNFVVTPAARQQKIIFLMNPPLRKCVKILSIQKERGSIFEKHIQPKQVLQGPSLQ